MACLRTKFLFLACALLFLLHRWWIPLWVLSYDLVVLPARWNNLSAQSVISQEQDHFDLTFGAYDINQSTAGAGYADVVPPILHHINLGSKPPRAEWVAARMNCLQHHKGWQSFVWDDASASTFVQEHYPHLKDMWDTYRYPVQRVDALRYMILQKYGGAVLDFDLSCKRSMGPLRRFDFVAPAAHPTGFSVGMMLSSPNNTFVRDLVDSLPKYNRAWFFLPYVTVMFSTGCHYASTIFTLQQNRSSFRILTGPPSFPRLHMLNGFVETPLFRHLGSSSWHSFDALLINLLVHPKKGPLVVLLVVLSFVAGSLVAVCLTCRLRKRRDSGSDVVGKENGGNSPILKVA